MRQLPPTRPSEQQWSRSRPPDARATAGMSLAAVALFAAALMWSLSPLLLLSGVFAATVVGVAVRGESRV